jgi:hypothetical protein
MKTIFDLAVLLYSNNSETALSDARTPGTYLPKMAGRWKNMLIVAPKEEVMKKLAIKFSKRQEEFALVSFHNIFIYLFIHSYLKGTQCA